MYGYDVYSRIEPEWNCLGLLLREVELVGSLAYVDDDVNTPGFVVPERLSLVQD